MGNKIAFKDRINFKILVILLVLLAITAVIVSSVNQNNIRNIYEQVYTERVLVTNALMATVLQSEDVKYFVDLMTSKDEEFKQRQVQFYYDRQELWALQEAGASEEEEQYLLDRLASFHEEMSAFKTDHYWEITGQLRELKEVSGSTYLYVMANTGLKNTSGETLWTFIFDAEDDAVYSSPDMDGLGTSDVSSESLEYVYATGVQMEWVLYYNDVYGELYYSYAPIIHDGEVIAILGTDLDLQVMNEVIGRNTFNFNMVFLLFSVVLILAIFIYLQRSVTKPLSSLTNTAQELAQGNVYSPVSETALQHKSEIGALAHAIDDMCYVYQDMVKSTESLFDATNVGKLEVRNDESNYKGDIRKVIKQINETLDVTTQYLNSMPESLCIMDMDFDIHFRNERFIKNFGDMSAHELLTYVFPDNDVDDLQEELSAVLELEVYSSAVWIDDRCFSVIFKGIKLNELNNSSVLVIAIDITALMKEKENAQAAASAKSDFLSRMSHEMRTPMNAIIGMTKIANTTSDTARLKYCLDTIGTSSEHLLGIINDILDMSKIDAGKFELEKAPLNIEKMLMKVCNIVIDNMEKKRQKFSVVLGKDLDLNYAADDLRLSQVITNLLANASKFTPEEGKITLSVDQVEKGDAANVLRFIVADDGIGMTEEQISRLFNAFEQADGSISRKFGGTGLGLAISKNIIEKMGGHIWVESEPGLGSKFIFEVRLERASHQTSVIFDGIHPEDLLLLIVENDPDVLNRFLSITENFGIRSDAATNADEALELVDQAVKTNQFYDIIFFDCSIPGRNGLELVNQLKDRIDKNTVIIVTTFLEWHQIENDALKSEITRYITKPLFPSSIIDAINDVVGTTLKTLDIKTDAMHSSYDLSEVSILLAEDIDINREIFLALLEDTHLKVDIAENGAEAVALFEENPDKYDLILMDIQMPEMDGFQATKAIRGMNLSKAKDIPIIAMTANAFKEDVDNCLNCGMNDHIAKPIDEKIVIDTIIKYALPDN